MNEAAFKALVSGESRGIAPACLRAALAAASTVYGLGTRIRNLRFRLIPPAAVGVPVVSVGNLTAGGTGKTPFVAWVVNQCLSHGTRPAILSRGYRSLDGEENDEKRVLDRLCPGFPHVQNRDRIAGAKRLVKEYDANAIVLDDGFQHRRIARDLDIVLIDALNPWGFGWLLPRGLLREPRSSLQRADLIVLTRVDLAPEPTLARLRDDIRATRTTAPIVEVAYTPRSLVDQAGRVTPIESLRGTPVLGFCGIGNPEGFRKTLHSAGVTVVAFHSYSDHYHYQREDLARLVEEARRAEVGAIVTTEKDLVKLPELSSIPIPLRAVRIATEIIRGEELLQDRLADALGRPKGLRRTSG